jgi:hypothetical protein
VKNDGAIILGAPDWWDSRRYRRRITTPEQFSV